MSRTATIDRKTTETAVRLVIELDGGGVSQVATGVGFLDHMLNLFSRHGRIDLRVEAKGDRHVDDHHTVEDVGICLGLGIAKALGDKAGIHRYGHFTLPMDESLATVGIDLSGRPACVWKVPLPAAKVGSFDVELAEEFWRGVANHGGINYHAVLHYGSNTHHILEAVFKASGRALRQAVAIDPGLGGAIPSTKGVL